MADQKKLEVEEVRELVDNDVSDVSGGGKGGRPGRCPGCDSAAFTSLGGNKIRCNDCGWEGTKADIGL